MLYNANWNLQQAVVCGSPIEKSWCKILLIKVNIIVLGSHCWVWPFRNWLVHHALCRKLLEGIIYRWFILHYEGPKKQAQKVTAKFYKINIQGPFAKSVDSPYYSESELCGGAVTVSFSKYPPWQAMHFLQRSTHFSKTCCRPLITSKFLVSELPFHDWKSPEIAWVEIRIEFCVRLGKSG
jgi:hypothetical protein